ncbi:MAG: lamin tail domain-containing protein [Bacteroidales bacterium]|nr:lamin tail domain-containing protein [Bacteroidales bacterium]
MLKAQVITKQLKYSNGTGSSINLSSYSLKRQTNGSGSFADELSLSGTLSNNSTYVIVYSSAGSTLSALANLLTASAVVQFNGNDAVALYKSGVQIDVVGVVDPNFELGC